MLADVLGPPGSPTASGFGPSASDCGGAFICPEPFPDIFVNALRRSRGAAAF